MKYAAKINLRIKDKKLTFDMRKSIAKTLFWHVRRIIPRDDYAKRSADPRKIYGSVPSWHLQDRGAAFVSNKRVASRGYKGKSVQGKEDEITFVFTNPKITGEKANVSEGGLFDYADYVTNPLKRRGAQFRDELDALLNSGIVEDAIEKAFDDYWDKL